MKPLSISQKYVWLDQRLNEDSIKYNIGGYVTIRKALDVDVFKIALTHVLSMQDIFSFSFDEVNGIPVCKKTTPNQLIFLDFSMHDEIFVQDWIEADFKIGFSLSGFPPYKLVLIKSSETRYTWYTKIHHILADGESFKLIFNTVSKLYHSSEFSSGDHSYTSFIEEDFIYQQSPAFLSDKTFWLNKFIGLGIINAKGF